MVQKMAGALALACFAVALVALLVQGGFSSRRYALEEIANRPVTEQSFFSGGNQLHLVPEHKKMMHKHVVQRPMTPAERANALQEFHEASEQVDEIQGLLKKAKKNQKFMHKIETPDFWGGGQTLGLSQTAIQKHKMHRMMVEKP